MTAICTLSVYADDGTTVETIVHCYNAVFPGNGFPIDVACHQIDPINAMGVNFTRERIIRQDAEPFQAVFHVDFADHPSAVTAARIYRQFKGKYLTMDITMAGTDYALTNRFVVKSVVANPMSADLVSNNASSGTPQAVVELALLLQYTGLDS